MARALALLVAIVAFTIPLPTAAQATPDNYSPRPGVTFNSPLGSSEVKRAIFRKIIRSINSTPRGEDIDIFSWNFLTREGTDALLRAQRRGVRVRLIMDRSNDERIYNQPFRRLQSGLRKGNRTEKRRSWARVCAGSCRGKTGSAHSKFYMFSKAGRSQRVVIQGSANFTLASSNNQWNDIYTHVGNRAVWNFAREVFNEAAKDKPVRRPYAQLHTKRFRLLMFPKGKYDPVMELLNSVKCRGAKNTASGRTRIRIAPDVIRTGRGMGLARKLRRLWEQGCDMRIGYTVVGVDIGRMLRSPAGRGPVPMKHLVQDFNGDGEFDNYFHLKAMSLVGNVGGDRANHVLLNGSANWSGLSGVSDENLGIYYSKRLTLRYQDHIDYWYENFPQSATPNSPEVAARRAAAPSGGLVFGSGPDAVYEDGTRYSSDGIDPFASMELD